MPNLVFLLWKSARGNHQSKDVLKKREKETSDDEDDGDVCAFVRKKHTQAKAIRPDVNTSNTYSRSPASILNCEQNKIKDETM